MKITKYEHACLFIEKESTNIVVDPGSFTTLPSNLENIDFIIVTEEHYDHFNVENIRKILKQSPDAKIFSTKTVVEELVKEGIPATAITGEQTKTLGNCTVTFYETDHAVVYQQSPCRSLAIKIDDLLYYPSDSYKTIPDSVKVLAVPTSGPWFKVSESIEFLRASNFNVALATHNALNSDIGNKVTNNYLVNNALENQKLIYVTPGETYTV